jgi:hypothetical protein
VELIEGNPAVVGWRYIGVVVVGVTEMSDSLGAVLSSVFFCKNSLVGVMFEPWHGQLKSDEKSWKW